MFVLIFFMALSVNGALQPIGGTTAEFASEAACKDAGLRAVSLYQVMNPGARGNFLCALKG